MPKPDRPLNFRADEMTLDGYIWLTGWMQTRDMSGENVARLKDLLADCSDWTPEEVGHLRMKELADVFAEMNKREETKALRAVPKASEDNSSSTQPESGALSPAG
jgi:hypothetical protein